MSAPPALETLSPFDPSLLSDPWDYYRRVRERAPVYREPNTGIFLISSFSAVSAVLRDWERFSNRFARAMGGLGQPPPEVMEVAKQSYPPVDTMLTADPPEQRRFRKLVNKAFSAKRVETLEARVEEIANELVARIEGRGRAELLSEFAQPLPLTLIAEQLGAPREDLALFRKWTDGFVAQLSGVASLLSILQQLLVAGNETTASAIVEGLWLLIQHPAQLARVQRTPALIPNLVEEVLRLATPTANMWRLCTQDTEIEGTKIPAGSMCMVRFAAANRDPAQFPDPEGFDVGRANAVEHLAFGMGIHHCLGAALARKEMNVAFRTLLGRLDGFALDAGAPAPRHKPSILLWGFDSLPITYRRRSS